MNRIERSGRRRHFVESDGHSWRRAAYCAVALLASACSSSFHLLEPAALIPELAGLGESRSELPLALEYVQVSARDGRSDWMAVEEVGRETADHLVVMVHGVLSDRRSWSFVAGDLGRDHRLWLVDLLGCGDSSKPDPADLAPDGYSPTAQARFVLEGLRQMLENREDTPRIVLVGHSLGASVILRMLGDPDLKAAYSDVVDAVDRAVLFAPLDFAVEEIHPAFEKIVKLGATDVALGRAIGAMQRKVVRSSMQGVFDTEGLPQEEPRRVHRILKRRETRRPAKAMILQAVPLTEERRPDPGRVAELVADYANVTVPAMMVWGSEDRILPVTMGYRLLDQLPDARLTVVGSSMHALPTERPQVSANVIREFLAQYSGDTAGQLAYIDPFDDRYSATRIAFLEPVAVD